MLRHRLSKFGKTSLLALCALLVGGMFNSCQDHFDEYTYDDGDQPSWLGESVYSFLRNNTSGHSYNYYADIVDRLGQTETFNRTGSKTLFVADDAAFERFFRNNNWGVKSFSDLTTAQMNVLLKASMLDDAMLLDMLSASNADVTSEGTCMRRLTSLTTVDTIPVVTADQMPQYNKYWDALRGKERDASLRIAMDGTDPMMIHFLPDFLRKKGITEDDISFLLRKNGEQVKTYKTGEVYIYDKKVMASGVINDGFSDDTMTITCKNGYLYRLDEVLVPPSNMAAEMRQREDLSVLSRLFDRFCLPVYDNALTRSFNSVTGSTDSIFRLRYYTIAGGGGIQSDNAILKQEDQPLSSDVLKFDPGWNQYVPENTNVQADMAAILAPNNDAMLDYFTSGSGSVIMSTYAPDAVITDVESLNKALDQVPEKLIAPLLNNLMQNSFVSTVPSRFDKIVDDANDEIEGVKEAVTECIIANNGVVYIVNQVFGPTQYTAVAAPSLILNNMFIMRSVISQLGYNSFLLAKKAVYSLFIPDDKAFLYYDPVSIVRNRIAPTSKPKLYELHYDANNKLTGYNGNDYLYYKTYDFDINEAGEYEVDLTTEIYSTGINLNDSELKFFIHGGTGMELTSTPVLTTEQFMYNRMSDLIDNLIIVGDITSGNKYYLTKGGNAVKVDFSDPSKPIFQGGEQLDNGMKITSKQTFAKQINGMSFNTAPADGQDAWITKNTGVPTPTTKSLYTKLTASAEDSQSAFYEFMKLAAPENYEDGVKVEDVVEKIFPSGSVEDSVKTYSMFYSNNRSVYNGVSLFQGYNYTVYVPSNDAVKEMIDKGLPTWADLNNSALGVSDGTPAQAASALRLLNKVFRYHIQDNSVFVDNLPMSNTYETSYINDKGVYEVVNVVMSGGAMTVTDKCGNTANVLSSDAEAENKTWNVICRDIEFRGTSKNPYGIISSSASVAHHIDKMLCFEGLFGYDGLVQRFAPGGEKVDTLLVDGKDGLYEAANGKKYYLIASKVNTFIGIDGKKYTSAGYIMEPKPASQAVKLSRERYIKDRDNNLILITEEGYRVSEDTDGNMQLVVETKVETDANGESVQCRYVQRFDNNGITYDKVLLDKVPLTSTPEEELQ